LKIKVLENLTVFLKLEKLTTVFSLIVAHAPLFFEAKILGFFTLVPPYVCFKNGGALLEGALY
jgi:hypothetical protein